MYSPINPTGTMAPAAALPSAQQLFDSATTPAASPTTSTTTATGFDPNPSGGAMPANLMLERAARLGSMPASQVARVVIQTKGAEAGLPDSYIQTALHAQDLAASLEQNIDQLSNSLVGQLQSSGGSMDGLFDTLRLLDQRSTQLLNLEQLLRDNFELARRDPKTAQSQLEQWLGQVNGTGAAQRE